MIEEIMLVVAQVVVGPQRLDQDGVISSRAARSGFQQPARIPDRSFIAAMAARVRVCCGPRRAMAVALLRCAWRRAAAMQPDQAWDAPRRNRPADPDPR